MNNLPKVLYEKFFLRDFLGKLGPGAMVTLLLFQTVGSPESALRFLDGGFAYFVTLPLFYVVGVSLQIIGERIGLHSSSPRPTHIFFFPTTGNWAKANEDFLTRYKLIRTAPSEKWTNGLEEQRDRIVYLKEGAGNMALALAVSAICLFIMAQKSFSLLAVSGAFMLYISHIIYASRQAYFEISMLGAAGLLDPDTEESMITRIGRQGVLLPYR